MKITLIFTLLALLAVSVCSAQQQAEKNLTGNSPLEKHIGKTSRTNIDKSILKSAFFIKKNKPAAMQITTKQKLDSIYYNYIDGDETYTDYKDVFDYNVEGKVVEYNEFYYDFNFGWLNEWKEEYSYDESGNLALMISYFANDNEELQYYSKEDFEYNDNNQQTLHLISEWIESEQGWMPSFREEYFYDENSYDTMYLFSGWNLATESWDYYFKYRIYYNENGNVEYSLNYSWDGFDDTWILISKDENIYNSQGQLSTTFFYYWNPELEKFEPSDKTSYEYDENGNNILIVYSVWNIDTEDWDAKDKQVNTIDEYNNIAEQEYFNWNLDLEEWVPVDDNYYSYNNNYTYEDLVLPFVYDYVEEFFNHMLTELWYQYWDQDTGEWIADEHVQLYYSPIIISSVNNLTENSAALLYPNPSTDEITIKLPDGTNKASIKLFDVQGRILMQQVIAGNNTINISTLKTGIYFYHIETEGKIMKGKLLKE